MRRLSLRKMEAAQPAQLKDMLIAVHQKLLQQIEKNQLTIPKHQISLLKKGDAQQKQMQSAEERLSRIAQMKSNILSKLQQINKEEQLQKMKLRNQKLKYNSKSKLHLCKYSQRSKTEGIKGISKAQSPQSRMNTNNTIQNDESANQFLSKSKASIKGKVSLKHLKKQYIEFESRLQQKTKQFQEQIQKQKQQQMKQQMKAIQETALKNRRQAEKRRLKYQQQRQRQRQKWKAFQPSNRSKQLKRQRKLYLQLQQKYKALQREQSQKKHLMMLDKIRQKQLTVQVMGLDEHEKTYLSELDRMKREREEKWHQINSTECMVSRESRSKSKYYKQAEEEIEKRKAEEEKKRQLKYQLQQRIRAFMQKYRQQHPLKRRVKTQYDLLEKEDRHRLKTEEDKSLQRQKIINIGNQYMTEVRSKLIKAKPKVSSQLEMNQNQAKYRNYLSEFHQKRRAQTSLEDGKEIYSRELNRINIIMASDQPEEAKLEKIKQIALRLEHSPFGQSDSHLIGKIETKLKILSVAGL